MKDQRLEELLDRWEQSREQGVELTPDELCPDDPDLRRSLAAKIDQLRQLDTMLEERPESAVVMTTPKSIGKYTVIDRIAGGGMGVVYRCRQEKPSREVAVKLIHPLRISDNALKRFRLEAEVLGMFQHPGIATIHEAGLARIGDEELPFIAMELIKGSPLDTYVTTHRPSTREIVSLLVRICGAVAHAHEQGVIHRDLKPANVIVDGAGQPHVVDFGLARLMAGSRASVADPQTRSAVIGSMGYMSPEQLRHPTRKVDARSDVYSLGVVLYASLTGKTPFVGEHRGLLYQVEGIAHQPPPRLSKIDRQWRGDLEAIVNKAMEKDPDDRYQSVDAFADDLRQYLSGGSVAARPLSPAVLLWRSCKRHPAVTLLAITTMLATLAGLVISLHFGTVAAQSQRHAVKAAHEAERNRAAADEKEREIRKLESLTAEQGERVRRDAYHLRLLRVSDLSDQDPVLALRWLEDEERCPPEWRGMVWHALHAKCDRLLFADLTENSAYRIEFSPDERLVAAICNDQLVHVWNLLTGEHVCKRNASARDYAALAFTPNNARLIVGVDRGDIRVLTTSDFSDVRRFKAHEGELVEVIVSPDGRWLASAGRDRQVKVWDTQSWSEVSRLPESDVPIATIAFTADSTQLVAMRTSRETTWWNLIEQHVDRVTAGDGPPTRFAAISPDLQWIAASHRHLPSETMLFDASTGELRRHIRSLRRPIRVHKFSPDSRVLARGDSSGCLEVWDLHNNQPALNLSAHQEAVNDIVFSLSGNLLASASQRGSIKVWKTRIAQSQQIHKMNDSVRQLIVLKDDTVAVLDNTGRLDVLSPGGSTPVSWSTSRPSKILAFTMTQNAKALFCARGSNRIEEYGVANQTLRDSFKAHSKRIWAISLSSDETKIALGSWDGTVSVWESDSKRLLSRLELSSEDRDHSPRVLELVFTVKDDLLIADSAGGVHRWDIRSEKPSWSIDAHEGAITGLVVSTDQTLFATSSEDRTAAVWRVAGGGRVTSLTGHTDPVRTIAFSPNARTVLTGSADGTVRAWDRLTGNEQATLAKEQCVIRQIAFSRSGNACFYGCEDGTVRKIEPEQQ